MALFALLPARADVRIVSSPGGAVEAYLAAFARVRQSGERVISCMPPRPPSLGGLCYFEGCDREHRGEE
jgi:hypothetical protein